MERLRRWDPAIAHYGPSAFAFVDQYFKGSGRRVLFVGGAGFDPRTQAVATQLHRTGVETRGCLVREIRPKPPLREVETADTNLQALRELNPHHDVLDVEIFGDDGAVIGGRNAIGAIATQPMDEVTDIVLDLSALSVGTAFPIARYLVHGVCQSRPRLNLHVFVTHEPALDAAIRSLPSDAPGHVHGFKGESTLDKTAGAAKLWLPQLEFGAGGSLARLFDFVQPHDTCPILPFPSHDPRSGDRLAEEFLTELESTWMVDTRNVVYANEADPLDLYRTILRLDDLRRPVFEGAGGSMLVLSPIGSKVMALGALMAALERDLPVAHLESIGYAPMGSMPAPAASGDLVHVWLEGDAYPDGRPPLFGS
jgi:hypothetical protein